MSQCNYCHLQKIKFRAKKQGMGVSVRQSDFRGGKDVYVHPKTIQIPRNHKYVHDMEEGIDKYWVCWFAKIGKSCEC